MALVGRIFIGLGMSAVLMGSLKIFNNWFRQNEFGFISGSILSLGHLGALLAAAPLVFMTLLIGWRRCFLFLGVFVIVMTVLILFFVKDTPEEKMGGRPSLGGTKRRNGKTFFSSLPVVFSSRHFWFISMSSLIRYGSLISIQGFLGPLYLIEILGYSPQESGNILSMISIGYLIGSPLAGRLSDSVFQSRKKVMLTGLSLFAILILPFLCDRSQNTIFWSTIFFGLGFSASVGAVSFAHVKELYPEEVAGLALTASNLFNIVGGGLSQHLLGIVIGSFPKTDSGYPLQAYHLTFIILFIFSTMAFLIYLGVRDTHPLQPQKPDQSSFLNGAKRT
jgi:sugar phosphate permease